MAGLWDTPEAGCSATRTTYYFQFFKNKVKTTKTLKKKLKSIARLVIGTSAGDAEEPQVTRDLGT